MSKKLTDKRVNLNLVGLDGNAYIILAHFKRSASAQGWSEDEIDLVLQEAQSKDYNHLLSTLQDYCDMGEPE